MKMQAPFIASSWIWPFIRTRIGIARHKFYQIKTRKTTIVMNTPSEFNFDKKIP